MPPVHMNRRRARARRGDPPEHLRPKSTGPTGQAVIVSAVYCGKGAMSGDPKCLAERQDLGRHVVDGDVDSAIVRERAWLFTGDPGKCGHCGTRLVRSLHVTYKSDTPNVE